MIYEESLVHWRLRGIAGTLEITRYCRCIGDYEVLLVHWRLRGIAGALEITRYCRYIGDHWRISSVNVFWNIGVTDALTY